MLQLLPSTVAANIRLTFPPHRLSPSLRRPFTPQQFLLQT